MFVFGQLRTQISTILVVAPSSSDLAVEPTVRPKRVRPARVRVHEPAAVADDTAYDWPASRRETDVPALGIPGRPSFAALIKVFLGTGTAAPAVGPTADERADRQQPGRAYRLRDGSVKEDP